MNEEVNKEKINDGGENKTENRKRLCPAVEIVRK